ncbi:MAG TPA: Hsp70 family protein [Anaeromyxobacteraceae bacterium]|nr:Hsp70 family protein [Anaeromyxobacteraceae bacterium]
MADSEVILGIDLGSTYSTAAALIGGRIHYALDSRGESCIPSVVHFPRSGPPIVGFEADKLRATDPENTVFGIKRLIGHGADSPAARLLDACSAFRIKPSREGEAVVLTRSGERSASEIASIILRHLRERSEARFHRRIGKAVCTVPVTATPEIREAMIRCGRMAGLEVVRVVSEPCAGAVARGAASDVGSGNPIMVYDFGGGTFDASVVKRTGQQLRVLASSGDDCLGGDDLDLAFTRWVSSGIYRTLKKDVTQDAILWNRLQRACERVKRVLSGAPEARLTIPDAFVSGGKEQRIDYAVTREHLKPVWAELVERSIEASKQAISLAGLSNDAVAGVLLIGGTSFVPQVRIRVAEAFRRPCVLEDEPQTAVARGAALLAAQPALLAA